jgi:hypothetical protein
MTAMFPSSWRSPMAGVSLFSRSIWSALSSTWSAAVFYQTPAGIRRAGAKRIETWLHNRKVHGAAALARAVVEAAEAQHTILPGEELAADMVVRLAKG